MRGSEAKRLPASWAQGGAHSMSSCKLHSEVWGAGCAGDLGLVLLSHYSSEEDRRLAGRFMVKTVGSKQNSIWFSIEQVVPFGRLAMGGTYDIMTV
jgi:hypothetical protein